MAMSVPFYSLTFLSPLYITFLSRPGLLLKEDNPNNFGWPFNGPESVVIVLPINNRLYGPQVFYEPAKIAERRTCGWGRRTVKSDPVKWTWFGVEGELERLKRVIRCLLYSVLLRRIRNTRCTRSFHNIYSIWNDCFIYQISINVRNIISC